MHKNYFACLFSVHNTRSLSCHEQLCLMRLSRDVPIEDDKIMVSFDVTSSYMNIPLIDMLNIIKDYVNNDDRFNRKTVIPQYKFFELVNLVLTNIPSN